MSRDPARFAALLALSFGCTATAVRTYPEPIPYVQFAAQEAIAAVGFQATRVGPKQVEGERSIRLGLLVGQGGEHVRVTLRKWGDGTHAEIVSRKRLIGFLAGRHQQERVATYLDDYVASDVDLRSRILEAAR